MLECLRCGVTFTHGCCPRCRGQGYRVDDIPRLRRYAHRQRVAMQPVRAELAGCRDPKLRKVLRAQLRALEDAALAAIDARCRGVSS